MSNLRIIKGDMVKLISGALKGTTGKVVRVFAGRREILIENVGVKHRKIKPSRLNPRGGQKDIHVPVPIHKVALIIDEKTGKTSRVGLIKNADGGTTRVARQDKDKEIK